MNNNWCLSSDVRLGKNVKLSKFINLYGCEVGDNTKIGAFVEIQKNAKIGRNCKISSHSFICEGVTIEDNVFVGHGVIFTNDSYPRATTLEGELQTEKDWSVEATLVKRGASVGSGATLLPNLVIGENALIGAGSVVTRDVPANAIVAGNPARFVRFVTLSPRSKRDRRMSINREIPFLDLVTPHLELEEELVAIFRTALRTAGFVGGPMVAEFEREFAQYCGTRDCVGVGSGTDALRFALVAAGLGRGDTVVTVPHTFIATTEAISQAGALPEFVDIDERTYNMDPNRLQAYLEDQCYVDRRTGKLFSKKTQRPVTAILPVHLYGQMADMDPLVSLAGRYGLIVIEDASQAHGAEYFSHAQDAWRRAGSLGAAAAFSFFPGKNLGACGEAGAVVTNDGRIAEGVRMLRDHGQTGKYYHRIEGYNGRLDAIQAGVLRIKLGHLPEWNRQRREIADRYHRMFAAMAGELGVPCELPSGKGVYHLYVIRHPAREELRAHLAAAGIICGLHYPIPLHLQEAYSRLGYRKGDFPVAEKAASEVLSLPIYPQLSHEQQTRIADLVREFVHGKAQRAACVAGGR